MWETSRATSWWRRAKTLAAASSWRPLIVVSTIPSRQRAAVASAQPDTAHNPDAVSAEPKKKKRIVQRKPRNQFAEQQSYASGYAPDRRNQAPLGFLGLFLGDSGRGR